MKQVLSWTGALSAQLGLLGICLPCVEVDGVPWSFFAVMAETELAWIGWLWLALLTAAAGAALRGWLWVGGVVGACLLLWCARFIMPLVRLYAPAGPGQWLAWVGGAGMVLAAAAWLPFCRKKST